MLKRGAERPSTLKTEQDGNFKSSRINNGQATKGVRWMPWHQEPKKGVAWLRKAAGSCQASIDPRIPEWGNPAGLKPSHHHLNT